MGDSLFSGGAVPTVYHDIYSCVYGDDGDQIDRSLFFYLHQTPASRLNEDQLNRVWNLLETRGGVLSRISYFKALAYIALLQQDKAIGDKILESYEGKELPVPRLGDLSELRAMSQRARRERNPGELTCSLQELCQFDTVIVSLLPERKGLLVKYNEYEVRSKRFEGTVNRRYSDFDTFQSLLLQRFPYRIIPPLPPKRIMGQLDKTFLDSRRRHLQQFLTHVARHPVVRQDEVVKFFFTYQGPKVEEHMKNVYRNVTDEFVNNPIAAKAKSYCGPDAVQQADHSRAHLLSLCRCMTSLRDFADHLITKEKGIAEDTADFARCLSHLCDIPGPVSTWATGNSTAWTRLLSSLGPTGNHLLSVANKQTEIAIADEDGVLDQVESLLAILQGFKDLVERLDRGLTPDRSSTISKMTKYVLRRQSSNQVNDPTSNEAKIAEAAMVEQEQRHWFSMVCLQFESQLVHLHLDLLATALHNMVRVSCIGHNEIRELWMKMQPLIESIIVADPHPLQKKKSIKNRS